MIVGLPGQPVTMTEIDLTAFMEKAASANKHFGLLMSDACSALVDHRISPEELHQLELQGCVAILAAAELLRVLRAQVRSGEVAHR